MNRRQGEWSPSTFTMIPWTIFSNTGFKTYSDIQPSEEYNSRKTSVKDTQDKYLPWQLHKEAAKCE